MPSAQRSLGTSPDCHALMLSTFLSGAIWVTIVLNPTISARDKAQLWQQLDRWTRLDVCPLEDPDQRSHPSPADAHRRLRARRRTGHNNPAAAADASSESDDDSAAPQLPPPDSASRPPILGPDPSAPNPPVQPSSAARKRSRRRGYFRPRTIFHKALDAIKMNWDNHQLKLILTQDVGTSSKNSTESGYFDDDGHPLWHGKACIFQENR